MITLKQLNAAVSDVHDELIDLGFWDDKLLEVDVKLVVLHPLALAAYGWKRGGRLGDINIPRFSFPRFADWLEGRHTSLRAVLRHEYGHATADTHPRMIRSEEFRSTFGGCYCADFGKDAVWFTDKYVSAYASTQPCEDFAETFQLFVTRGGKLPYYHHKRPIIRRKWNFIDRMRKAIKAGRSSF